MPSQQVANMLLSNFVHEIRVPSGKIKTCEVIEIQIVTSNYSFKQLLIRAQLSG